MGEVSSVRHLQLGGLFYSAPVVMLEGVFDRGVLRGLY